MVGFRGELCGVEITIATTFNIATDLEKAHGACYKGLWLGGESDLIFQYSYIKLSKNIHGVWAIEHNSSFRIK